MRQIKRPRILYSWVGKTLMASITAGVLGGMFVPFSKNITLTYWTIFGIIAALSLLVIVVACVIDKCWAYLGVLCAVLAILSMAFIRVILPNI